MMESSSWFDWYIYGSGLVLTIIVSIAALAALIGIVASILKNGKRNTKY